MFKGKKRVYILNIIVVLFIIMISFSMTGMWPFGDNSIAAIDLGSQYLGFYDYLGGVFKGTEGVFYSFNKGAGGGMFALWTYYLMSPFNIVYAFFNGDTILQGVQVVYILKLLTMTITSTHYFKRKGLEDTYNTMFTLGWVFSGYMVMYRIHLMWVDALIYLPLLVLALDEGLESNRFGKYIFWLTLTIYSSYYIGYKVGIFTVIYVLYRYLTKEDETLKIVGYIKACILSGILSLWVLIPTAYSMVGGLKTGKVSELLFTYYPTNLVSSLRFVDVSAVGYNVGAPLIMCGTAIIIYLLIVLQHTTKKQRVAYLLITLLYLLSFTVRPVSRIWTIGQDETGYLHRFAFTYVWFNLTYLVHNKQYLRQELGRIKGIVLASVWVGTSVYLIFQGGTHYTIIGVITLVIGVFYSVVVLFKFKGKQLVLLALMVLEVITLLTYAGLFSDTTKVSEVEGIRKQQEESLQVMGNKERMSRIYYGLHEGNYNNGFNINEATLTHTSSTMGKGMREVQKQLGMMESYSFIGSQGMNEVAATLLNVEFIDTRFNQNYTGYLEDKTQFEAITDTVYLNKARLGFGYTISELVKSNDRGLNISGITEALFGQNYLVEVELEILDSKNIEVKGDSYTIIDTDDEAYINYAVTEGVNYVYKERDVEYTTSTVTEEPSKPVNKVWYNHFLTAVDEGESIYHYRVKYDEPVVYSEVKLPKFYRLNTQEFFESVGQYYNTHSQFNLKEQGRGRIEGSVNNTYDEPYLQVSIPYEEGWVAYVNGVSQEVRNSMNYLAVDIPEGESEIVLEYKTPLLRESVIIVVVLLIGYVIVDIMVKRYKNKKGCMDV